MSGVGTWWVGAVGLSERSRILGAILSAFEPGRLIDLGAGHGIFSIQAHEAGWQVTAVDARTDRWPSESPDGIEWVQADIRDLGLGPYDLVLCLGLFYHLRFKYQIELLRRVKRPMVIDTHVDHGHHRHRLSEPVTVRRYEGRLYKEPNALTAAVVNKNSFWPTLESFRRMVLDCGFSTVLTADPWHASDRTMFVALP